MPRRRKQPDDDSLAANLFLLAWERPAVGTVVALLLLLAALIFHNVRLPLPTIGTDAAPPLAWFAVGLAALMVVGTLPGWANMIVRALLGKSKPPPPPPPDIEAGNLPYTQLPILTDGEKAFYDVLIAALPNQQIAVLLKVRLKDLVHIPDGFPRYQSWFRRVSQKHVDFLLCDKLTVVPFLAIELDDRSHDRADRASSDRLKDIVLPHVGIPLERVRCQTAYDVLALAHLIARYAPKIAAPVRNRK